MYINNADDFKSIYMPHEKTPRAAIRDMETQNAPVLCIESMCMYTRAPYS